MSLTLLEAQYLVLSTTTCRREVLRRGLVGGSAGPDIRPLWY